MNLEKILFWMSMLSVVVFSFFAFSEYGYWLGSVYTFGLAFGLQCAQGLIGNQATGSRILNAIMHTIGYMFTVYVIVLTYAGWAFVTFFLIWNRIIFTPQMTDMIFHVLAIISAVKLAYDIKRAL